MERMSLHRIDAPFSPDQVYALNRFQNAGITHPFTCIFHSDEPLVAQTDGWHCPICPYHQTWAWKEMLVDPLGGFAGNA
jgi:hypothetical protein